MSRVVPVRGGQLLPLPLPFLRSHRTSFLPSSTPRYRASLYAAPPTTTVPMQISGRRNSPAAVQRPARLIVLYGFGCDAPSAISTLSTASTKAYDSYPVEVRTHLWCFSLPRRLDEPSSYPPILLMQGVWRVYTATITLLRFTYVCRACVIEAFLNIWKHAHRVQN
jgi:hypothetical protein